MMTMFVLLFFSIFNYNNIFLSFLFFSFLFSKVVLRIRPLNEKEIRNGDVSCVKTLNNKSISISPPTANRRQDTQSSTFDFSAVYPPETTQNGIFEKTVLPLVQDFLGGINTIVFIYLFDSALFFFL